MVRVFSIYFFLTRNHFWWFRPLEILHFVLNDRGKSGRCFNSSTYPVRSYESFLLLFQIQVTGSGRFHAYNL